MSKIWPPYENVVWHLQQKAVPPCTQDMQVEVAIVGGGMAGLSAAQAFAKKGKKVALFEQYFCGSGGTGESSGFVTSNAEISLTDFAKRFSPDVARQIWSVINGGIASIASNIEQYSFDCELTKSDALFAALSAADFKSMQLEHENLDKLGFKSVLYDQASLRAVVASDKLYGGVVYENSFGINAYAYCQELKRQLQSQGVQIFEETPVTKVDDHTLSTAHAQITADYIVICVDRFLPDLGFLVDDVYHVQNFVMASQQLTAEQIDLIFPAKKQFMVWDSQLLYNYFRLTPQGRMILGGSDLWTTYVNKPTCSYPSITRKLNDYFCNIFPQVKLQFEYQWSGLIGISKDIAPLVGPDKKFEHIFYVAACAGLPIAAAFGAYSADHLLDGRRDMDPYFSPYRSFKVQGLLQKILGKKLSFAICNALQQNIP